MKFKSGSKRFLTLNPNNSEGFTLVELIVVIAILAILAGVAVPAYSGYVTNANKTADQTLVSDVKQALELYYYSYPNNTTSGYVVLTTNGASGDGTVGDAAMQAVFGDGWQDMASLQYDGWALNSELLAVALNSAYAASVANSTYVTNSTVSDLLDNVQTVTQAAAGLLGTVTKTETEYLNALEAALGTDFLADAAAAEIIKDNGNGTYSMLSGDYDSTNNKISSDLQTQLSNLMVLSVAKEIDGMSSNEMLEILYSDEVTPYSGSASVAAQMAVQYAFFKAVDLNSDSSSVHFETLNSSLNNASGMTDVKNAFDAYFANNTANISEYLYPGWDGNSEPTMSEQVITNFEALGAIMTGVNTVSDNYSKADTLKDSGLYTSGSVSNDVNGYIGATKVAGTLAVSNLPENGIVIFFSVGNNGACEIIAYPDPNLNE